VGLVFKVSVIGLNFKNNFNSFTVEINEEGPKIKTSDLCIF